MKPRAHHGLTLIELLVSLVILSAVMIAITNLSQLAARDIPKRAARLRWLSAADVTTQLIEHDLLARDIVYNEDLQPASRVHASSDGLVIQTRTASGSTGTHQYVMDTHQLVVLTSSDRSEPSRQDRRVLLGDLSEALFNVDEAARIVRISLVPFDGQAYEKEIAW